MSDRFHHPSGATGAAPRQAAVNARIVARLGRRSVVLVGMMGAGKTSVGKRLANRLGLGFVDSDAAIEEAARKSVTEIFADHGEDYFRSGERRVIARLLGEGQQVIATGGGAFMNAETRETIARTAVSIWLKADVALLFDRVRRRTTRPLLQTPDPEGTLRRLAEERYPVYAEAALTVESRDVPHEQMVDDVAEALDAWLAAEAAGREKECQS